MADQVPMCWSLDFNWTLFYTLIRSEISRRFCNTVPQNNGEDELDRSCRKLRSIKKHHGRKEYPRNNKTKESQLDWSHLA